MIQALSLLSCIDNSGARLVQCIKVLRNGKFASLGDEIVVAVKKAKNFGENKQASEGMSAGKVKKGDVRRALIVRTTKETQRLDGRSVKFGDNACVLIGKDYTPLANRISGIIGSEVRKKKFIKIASLAPKIV